MAVKHGVKVKDNLKNAEFPQLVREIIKQVFVDVSSGLLHHLQLWMIRR
jgi:hypothetical protein